MGWFIEWKNQSLSRRRLKTHRASSSRAVRSAIDDRFVAIVRDLNSDGRGVVEAPDGQVLFITGAWPGEEVEVKRRRQGKVATAELISVIKPSTSRCVPVCDYHQQGSCGGCPWMFIDYAAQLQQKQIRLAKAVERINPKLPEFAVIEAGQTLGYRNRAQLKTDGVKLGDVAQGSHEIADVVHCPVLNKATQAQLSTLRRSLPKRDWRTSKNRPWTTIDIDDERGTALVNQRQVFRQGNSGQNDQLRNWLSNRLATLSRPDSVFELFCGSGNLTEIIAGQMDVPIIAIEGDGISLEALSARVLPNVQPTRVNLFSQLSISENMPETQLEIGVVLDPPRDGLKERDALKPWFMQAVWVAYVSCDLATWERDAIFLQGCGLHLDQVSGLDMFPQTPHIETLSVFKRQSR